MSFINKNFGDKPSMLKPVAIAAAIILVIGCIYFLGDKSGSQGKSALGQNEQVSNVGDVELVIAQWVKENPEAIIESLQSMQAKVAANKTQDAKKNIVAKKEALFNDKKDPQYAPKKYDVTIIEFFDYACGYCKKVNKTINALIKEDKKIRVIYKEFPIFGKTSMEASTVALAVNIMDPKSYVKFHDALMVSGKKGEAGALEVAKSVGINVTKLKKTMKNKASEIADQIQGNLTLGGSIGVTGTPGFVVGEDFIPGAVDLQTFKDKVRTARD